MRLDAKNLKIIITLEKNCSLETLLAYFTDKLKTFGVLDYQITKKQENCYIYIKTIKKFSIRNDNYFSSPLFEVLEIGTLPTASSVDAYILDAYTGATDVCASPAVIIKRDFDSTPVIKKIKKKLNKNVKNK